MRIPVIDIGGTHVKVLAFGHRPHVISSVGQCMCADTKTIRDASVKQRRTLAADYTARVTGQCRPGSRISTGSLSIMKLLNIIAILITLSAAFGYLNSRFIRLPTTIGIMLVSMLVSVGVFVLGHFGQLGLGIEEHWLALIRDIDFNRTLMVWMLGFLLFGGALRARDPAGGGSLERAANHHFREVPFQRRRRPLSFS